MATGLWQVRRKSRRRFRCRDPRSAIRHPQPPGKQGQPGCHHLTGALHHHLAILAVRPDSQGQGIGTALLQAHHATFDWQGIAAYLEASDERTRDLYLRHGYTDHGEPIELPDGPSMYPMVRIPGLRPQRGPAAS